MTVYISNNYHKIRSSIPLMEQYYKDALENVASYNSRLCLERRQRLPFLDSQTGVAQNHSNLWIPYRYRGPGRRHGQIYSYPSQRWKKKCSLPLPDIPLPRIKPTDVDIAEPDIHTVGTAENTVTSVDSDSKDVDEQVASNTGASTSTGPIYRDEYYNDWENLSEPPDAGEIDQRNSDSSDFEETYIRRKTRRKDKKRPGPAGGGSTGNSGTSRGRKRDRDAELAAERDKPYACDLCGARYKTRPGLTYHLSHSHNKPPPPDDELELPEPSPKVLATATSDAGSKRTPAAAALPAVTTSSSSASIPSVPPVASSSSSSAVSSSVPSGKMMGSKYCDFCLGNESENKKTGNREEMVSCADCGRCGHPSCLQFTANMIISVKKYPWQCIECKSCGICGTSDNDDQLLFCDDCDRGYHMYCLNPPLAEPPEGSWSCHLCIEEFYGGRKTDMFNAPGSTDP